MPYYGHPTTYPRSNRTDSDSRDGRQVRIDGLRAGSDAWQVGRQR